MDVYKECPKFENDRYILRLTVRGDCDGLLKVYSDKKAVPFFNGDNCHGDDFYYTTAERMLQALDFWAEAYSKGWFVRWSIIDKATGEAVGTIEEFHRDADDYFTNCGLLRLDLRSDYETAADIKSILALIVRPSFDLFGCAMVATKAVPSAVERVAALTSLGFTACDEKLKGFDGTLYGDYYALDK